MSPASRSRIADPSLAPEGEQQIAVVVDQRGSLTQTCQLALQSIDAVTERVSFSHKTLNCVRCFEEHAFTILDGVQPVTLSRLLRFAHHAGP